MIWPFVSRREHEAMSRHLILYQTRCDEALIENTRLRSEVERLEHGFGGRQYLIERIKILEAELQKHRRKRDDKGRFVK